MKKYKIREYHKDGYFDYPGIYDSREEAEEVIHKFEHEIEIRKKQIIEYQEIMDILGEYDRDGKRRETYKAVKKV